MELYAPENQKTARLLKILEVFQEINKTEVKEVEREEVRIISDD